MLETDGPYGEGSCASKAHNHHVDLGDSILANKIAGTLSQ